MGVKGVFLGWGLMVLGGYAIATWRGWEPFAEKRGFIPQSVRQAPGGYRSYSFWRGGK